MPKYRSILWHDPVTWSQWSKPHLIQRAVTMQSSHSSVSPTRYQIPVFIHAVLPICEICMCICQWCKRLTVIIKWLSVWQCQADTAWIQVTSWQVTHITTSLELCNNTAPVSIVMQFVQNAMFVTPLWVCIHCSNQLRLQSRKEKKRLRLSASI